MANQYSKQQKIANEQKIRSIQSELPQVVTDFMRFLITDKSDRTRLAYITDLRTFFYYLPREIPKFADLEPYQITVEHLNQLTLRDLEGYKDYLVLYVKPEYGADKKTAPEEEQAAFSGQDRFVTNDIPGLSRKICSLRAFFKYLYTHDLIEENITEKLTVPKEHPKEIIYLNHGEINRLIETVNSSEGLTEREKKLAVRTKERDIAIVTLLLGTGIRASEMVGLDLDHISMDSRSMIVTRKGGKEMTLYFNEDVERALADYLAVREKIQPFKGSENALFLSLQRKRLTTRALQNLIKKYGRAAVPEKTRISPHKMRSSFGTALYETSGDINMVATVLGHSNVNTTQKHYVHTSEELREQAAKMVDWTTAED